LSSQDWSEPLDRAAFFVDGDEGDLSALAGSYRRGHLIEILPAPDVSPKKQDAPDPSILEIGKDLLETDVGDLGAEEASDDHLARTQRHICLVAG
jgi:hypothetical protein